jgi:hydroxymethylpyrimidine pyrophosphatase-like HAD family hydrolase
MELYDQLYALYDEFDTGALRDYQEFVDVFPAVDSRVALDHWQTANDELDRRKTEIREHFAAGETFAEVASNASRDQAFTALDLLRTYDRAPNVLVLDVDETLRSAGNTDNEIPRDTLHVLTEFHELGVPIVICTGQTLENVKGFITQGLGSELVHSGDLSVVYEAGTGVFTPGHGADTKQLLYEDLDDDIRRVFDDVRSRILSEAPDHLRSGTHLQGNEFNVTMKPNFETGSKRARGVIDDALVYELDLLGDVVADVVDGHPSPEDDVESFDDWTADADDLAPAAAWARRFYADADPEIRSVLEAVGGFPDLDRDAIPERVRDVFERIDVAYYEADAAEIGSLELNKVVGVEAALDVLDVEDPFSLVMGDSKSDLRVMQWVADEDAGIAAAPEHASSDVLEHVLSRDELVFDRGASATMLRTVYAMALLARLDD